MNSPAAARPPFCPSAQPEMTGAVVFGVMSGAAFDPRVEYLDARLPVTPEVLALSGPVQPTEVFRFGAPCAGAGCRHFDGAACRLATKLVQLAPPATSTLPACKLRPDCRWWRQEGKAACMRCPQVVTLSYQPGDAIRRAADPDV